VRKSLRKLWTIAAPAALCLNVFGYERPTATLYTRDLKEAKTLLDTLAA
jgi:hypothetical protein